jgi:hypothetical protein
MIFPFVKYANMANARVRKKAGVPQGCGGKNAGGSCPYRCQSVLRLASASAPRQGRRSPLCPPRGTSYHHDARAAFTLGNAPAQSPLNRCVIDTHPGSLHFILEVTFPDKPLTLEVRFSDFVNKLN